MLDGISRIRAVSWLMIATYHITEFLNGNQAGPHISFSLSAPGVPLFLVISGFVLVHTHRPDERPLRFILKRLARIVPLYWLLTLVAILLIAWRPWFNSDGDISAQGILNSFLFIPARDLGGEFEPALFVGWTLNYIVVFYGLFALSLFAPARLQAFILAALVAALVAGAHLLPPGSARDFYGNPIQLEFIAGAGVAVLVRQPLVARWVRGNSVWPLGAIAFAWLLTAALLHAREWSVWPRLAAFGPPSALLVFAVAAQDLYRTRPRERLLLGLGRISYAAYLIHPLLLPAVGVIGIHLGAPRWIEDTIVLTATLALTAGAAWLSTRFFEKPVSDWLRRLIDGERPWVHRPVLAERTIAR